MLLQRIKQHKQEKTSLSRQVHEEGKANGWPKLAKEVTDISDELGIPDLNNVFMCNKDIKNANSGNVMEN